MNFRWAANTKASQAHATFADNSRHASPWAAQLDRQARATQTTPPRDPPRAWMRVIWACRHSGKPYDPVNHGGEKRFAKQRSEENAA